VSDVRIEFDPFEPPIGSPVWGAALQLVIEKIQAMYASGQLPSEEARDALIAHVLLKYRVEE
jgi:hypothetical protein